MTIDSLGRKTAEAQIVKKLMDVIDNHFEGKEGHRTNSDFINLCNRIQGKKVTLIFTAGDAFEKKDNNWWLPECCYTLTKKGRKS